MNMHVFKSIVFYGCVVSIFASFTDLEMEASSSANTTPKKVEFKKKVRVGVMKHTERDEDEVTEHDQDEVFETKHVHSSAVCKQSLIIILECKNKKKRESAYNFVASIISELHPIC